MRNLFGKSGIALIIILLLTTVVFLQRNLDYKAEARWGFRKNIIYLPNSKYAQYLTAGYDNILADYLYLWSIQFFHEKTHKERFSIIENVFNIITDLDPDYIEAYRIGAIMMIKDVYKLHGNPEGLNMAFRLLDKGIKNNPESWALPFEAATTAHFDLKDKKLANRYYRMAIESPTIPEKTKKRLSTAIGSTLEGFNKIDALKYWYQLFRAADDEVVKNIAYSHYNDLKIELDIEYLDARIKEFTRKYGVRPSKLQDLVNKGIAPGLPYDPHGLEYLYDYTTGKVTPPKGFLFK